LLFNRFYKSSVAHKRVELVCMRCHCFILRTASPVSCVQTTRVFVLMLMFVILCLFLAVYRLLVQRFEIFKCSASWRDPPLCTTSVQSHSGPRLWWLPLFVLWLCKALTFTGVRKSEHEQNRSSTFSLDALVFWSVNIRRLEEYSNIIFSNYIQNFTQRSSVRFNSIQGQNCWGFISVDIDVIDRPLIRLNRTDENTVGHDANDLYT